MNWNFAGQAHHFASFHSCIIERLQFAAVIEFSHAEQLESC